MKLAIFGGTGRAGQHLLKQALDAGYTVSVLVRDPVKVQIQDSRLTIVQGSLADSACLDAVLAGAQAVLSVLGPATNEPAFEISQGMQAILAGMKQNGVRRLIISAGAGVGDPADAPGLFHRLMNVLLQATAKNVFADMLQTVALVRQSDLDWTVVRAPMLTDAPGTGQIKVGMVGKGMGPRLSRADLARFMLQQVQNRQYVRQAPAISN